MAKPITVYPMHLFFGATDYAFNSKFNSSKVYNCTAYNRHIDEMLTDLLDSDFQYLTTDVKVACLKAFMVKYLL